MPPLSPVKILGAAKFLSHRLKLPTSATWQQPQGEPAGPQYRDSLRPEWRVGIPKLVPPWFLPQNNNRLFQDACDDIGKKFKVCHDTLIDAVRFAHGLWRLEAKIVGLSIMGPTAIGSPGCLVGSPIESNIRNFPACAAWSGNWAKYRDAAAAGISECFKQWQDGVTVPGMPWYPAFAHFPGPMAPPTPNVPSMLVALPSAAASQILTPEPMRQAMGRALDRGLKQHDKDRQYDALFDAIASVLAPAFAVWLSSQSVMNVLGTGPIPTFAPPFVPVGPVVGGNNIGAPGHLAA